MLRAGGVHRDERQVDVGLHHAGQVDLGLFSSLLQALHGHLVVAQVDAVVLLEVIRNVVHQALVEVVAAQPVVARRGQHLKHAVADLQDRHIERTAAQVVHQDLLVVLLVQAVGQRRRRGLVDDAQHIQARNAAGVLGRLALAVGEVCRHRDDGLRDRLAEIRFRVLLELLQDHGRDLLRRIFLAVDTDFAVGTHVPLDDEIVRSGLVMA